MCTVDSVNQTYWNAIFASLSYPTHPLECGAIRRIEPLTLGRLQNHSTVTELRPRDLSVLFRSYHCVVRVGEWRLDSVSCSSRATLRDALDHARFGHTPTLRLPIAFQANLDTVGAAQLRSNERVFVCSHCVLIGSAGATAVPFRRFHF